MTLISIIMPSYNHEEYISKAIESVLNQTFIDFEIIIIDDASKDGSKEIIRDYKIRDSRIRAIFHDENRGIARTLNEGVEESVGKYIAFIASDDIWFSDKLERQVMLLNENDNFVVWSEGLIIDNYGIPLGKTFSEMHHASDKKKSGDIFNILLEGNYICCQSAILKRGNLKGIRFDENLKYLNDYKFMLDLAKNYRFFFIPEPLVMYRIHGKNSIFSDKAEWRRDFLKLVPYIKNYEDKFSNDGKRKFYFNISMAYLSLGQKDEARRYFFCGMKLKPLDPTNIKYLLFIYSNGNRYIRRLLRRLYNAVHEA